MSEELCANCGDHEAMSFNGICIWCFSKAKIQENSRLKSQVKELEQKPSIHEWEPASEAVVGREYDVAGGKWQDFSQYADYETWYDMKNHVAVATCEDIEDVFPNFKGAYSDEYGSQYFYQPEWIRERPTPPTQEGEE